MSSDPLLSVEELARLWHIGSATVASLIAQRRIESLDGGRCVRDGRLDIPCFRRSWAERIRVDSPGAVRRIHPADGAAIHPAAAVAFNFHIAVTDGDAEAVWALSSRDSKRAVSTPAALVDAWRLALGAAISPDVSLTTGVYRLDPFPGVGIRLIDESPPLPLVISKPTPVSALGVITLVEEDGYWRADLGLARMNVNWASLLATALPEAPPDPSHQTPGSPT